MKRLGILLFLVLNIGCETTDDLVSSCEEDSLANCLTVDNLTDTLSGVYLVELDKEPGEVASFTQQLASEFDLDILHIYDAAAEGFSVRLPHSLVETLQEVVGVRSITEDIDREYAPTPEPEEDFDPVEETTPAPLPVPNQTVDYGEYEVPEGVTRIGGPYVGGLALEEIHVAVLDTGVDGSHPDLNVVAHRDVVGDSLPFDAHPGDPQGHGTHVAGIIGARADTEGMAGVAPGVAIHSVRILDSTGAGYDADIIAGIEYVLDNPQIRVVNMSLGGPAGGNSAPLQEAIDRMIASGVIVIIAAGNESQNTSGVVPAGFDSGVVVSAYSVFDNTFADFSNFGTAVDIAAPGTSIYSTYPDGTYAALDGTSMAAPHVAGAAALFIGKNGDVDNAQFLDYLLSTGEDGYDGQGGDHPEVFLNIDDLIL